MSLTERPEKVFIRETGEKKSLDQQLTQLLQEKASKTWLEQSAYAANDSIFQNLK